MDQGEAAVTSVPRRQSLAVSGPPSALRRHGGGLSLLVDGRNLALLEYAGAGGLRVAGTVYQDGPLSSQVCVAAHNPQQRF